MRGVVGGLETLRSLGTDHGAGKGFDVPYSPEWNFVLPIAARGVPGRHPGGQAGCVTGRWRGGPRAVGVCCANDRSAMRNGRYPVYGRA